VHIDASYVLAMARPFRFAVQALDLTDRNTVVAAARQAEALGYAEFYSYDHLGALDPFVPLVVAAEATSSLRVGPLVLNNEFHHPALLARTAATVDRMTGGRLVLGVGTGYAQTEHDAMGIELRAPGPRIQRFEESLVALRSLLDAGSIEMDGRHHHLSIDDLGVRPDQARVPILVGGHGRRVIEAAAPLADIFQFTGLTHAADGTPLPGGFGIDMVTERAHWLADATGDRNGLIERSILVQATHLGVGAEEASDRAAARLGVTREVVESTPFLLFGSVEQIVDKLESLREALGISHVVVRDAERFAPVAAALADR
jgi:probable F420-dependent oxidoreductase